jgi:hypothetical protein
VPADAADQSTLMKVLRTGIEPGKTARTIVIPEGANGLFEQPAPIGPYSLMKRLGGVRFAPPGSIDLATGAFTPAAGGVSPRILIYGPDVLIWSSGVAAWVTFKQPESEGMTKALAKAQK